MNKYKRTYILSVLLSVWVGFGSNVYAQYINPSQYNRDRAAAAAASASATSPASRTPARKQVRVKNRPIQFKNDSLYIDMDIEIGDMTIESERQLVMTPILSTKGYSKSLPPVVINGKKRHNLYRRSLKLNKGDRYRPYQVIKAGDVDISQTVNYKMAVPVEPWMRTASFSLEQDLCGCAGETQRISVDMIEQQVLVVNEPTFNFDYSNTFVSFIEPPREEIKNLSESDQAYIVFQVGKSNIVNSMGNNAEELGKIMNSFDYIIEEPTAKITGITITAYASPEGTQVSNKTLSERRAASLLNWIRQTQSKSLRDVRRVTSIGKGEDWETLSKLVKEDPSLTSAEKNAIQSIIDSTPGLDQREAEIKKYKGGEPYRYLLEQLYPELRRCDYFIEFSVPEFTLEKSLEMLKTKPGMLSQAEFYAIANTYQKGSKEFNQIFDIAVRLFPNDPVASLNAAAAELEADELTRAEQRLRTFKDDPRAWNNIGILLMKQRKVDEAEEYLTKAAEGGNRDAERNLRQIPALREEVEKYEKALEEYNFFNNEF